MPVVAVCPPMYRTIWRRDPLSLTPARVRTPATLAVAGMLLLAACGGGSSPSANGSAGGSSNEDLTGSVFVSRARPRWSRSPRIVAEEFEAANPDVDFTVDGPGTGDGFALFCNGETDISDASRAIKDEEAAACEEKGIHYVELQVGIDGIQRHHFAGQRRRHLPELPGPLRAARTRVAGLRHNWSDAERARRRARQPRRLRRVACPVPGRATRHDRPGRGVRDVRQLRRVRHRPRSQASARGPQTTRPDYTASGDDNVIIEGVSGSDSSLGWVGFAFADENTDSIKSLEVDGGDGCVAPTPGDDRLG